MGKSEYSENFTTSEVISSEKSKRKSTKEKNIDELIKPFNIACIKGDKGECGSRGKEGPRGRKGSCGPRGPRGHRGHTGDTGYTGPRGKRGPGFVWKGEWVEGTKYEPNDVVYFNGSSYIAITCNMTIPTTPTDWNILALGTVPIIPPIEPIIAPTEQAVPVVVDIVEPAVPVVVDVVELTVPVVVEPVVVTVAPEVVTVAPPVVAVVPEVVTVAPPVVPIVPLTKQEILNRRK